MSTLIEFINHPRSYANSHRSLLIEKALKNNEGILGPEGELVISTGIQMGRSANDKYIVVNELTENKVWWENNVGKMSDKTFKQLTEDVLFYFKSEQELFFTERSIGSIPTYSLGVEFVSTHASSALFTQYMFKPFESAKHDDTYRILHAPHFKLDPNKYGTRSDVLIVTCFKERMTIIVGTMYSGEIKKSMFSIMNYLLPNIGILPMHSGANQNVDEESSVFFGLSGTGKTTLSTDEGLQLIGDDEHGLSDNGIFNFEGGCYAKTYRLSPETEPLIYQASTRFSSFLENVKVSADRSVIDFSDDSLTENGRTSYPLSFIPNSVESGKGNIPKNIFYLSADAFGVLPPVSLLNSEQAINFFELGYSAKLAGTEVGIKIPKATFSSCFGAPFMLRPPKVYSTLLSKFISKYKIQVWLINTGWYGGSYGTGTRFSLKVTRNIIRQIQAHKLDNVEYENDEIFNLKIPKSVEHMDTSILFPGKAWANQEEYRQVARKLAASFEEQLKKIKS